MDEEQKKMAEELLFSEDRRPSFAKQLFFGRFLHKAILPFPETDKKEKERGDQLLQKLKEFVDRYLDPDAIDRNGEIPGKVIRGLGKLGVLGMTVPEEYGGLGMSQNSYCRVIEEVASRCGGTAVFINAHQSIGLKAILLFGTEEQKKRWLPPLARGEKIAAFALTEPNAGSDAAGIETRGVYDPCRSCWHITGEKRWITNGSIASVLTLMAKTEIETERGKEEKVSAFLMTPDMRGFEVVAPALEKISIRGTQTTLFRFTDVQVAEENMLGQAGGGLRICLTALDFGRTTFGAMCTGVAKYALDRALAHAKERTQFKRQLASFSLVKKKLAEMAGLVYAMDAATYLTAGLIDNGVEDVMLESAILKVFNAEALWQILYETMQIFGGKSFFTDEPFGRLMRDARLNMIGEGSNDVLRAFIGIVGIRDVGMELKNAFTGVGSALKAGGSLFKRFTRTPEVPVRSKQLQEEAKLLARTLQQFGVAIPKLLARHGEGIVEKQLLLDRLANCAIALYTMSAVLSKADRDLKKLGKKKMGNDLAVAKFYCKKAAAKAARNLKMLSKNLDAETVALSDKLTGIETK